MFEWSTFENANRADSYWTGIITVLTHAYSTYSIVKKKECTQSKSVAASVDYCKSL